MSQLFQVAHLVETVTSLFLELAGTANADLHLAKIRVFQGQILADVAYPATNLTGRISREGVVLSPR